MKKVIKLTENDLTNIVKRVMIESDKKKETSDNESLGIVLKGKRSGVFKNDEGEYCTVLRRYDGNKQKFQIIFSKNIGGSEMATRPAINSTSEKRILKFIKDEGFKLVNE